MINKRQRFVDMIGKKCGRLSVVNFAYFKKYPSGSSVAYWDCLCDCGNKKIIDGRSLRNGTTKSCNCLMREIASKTHKNKPKSEEQKRKMSLAAMNQKHSEERRKKNSLSKMGLYSGAKNPNWRGGTSREPYIFDFAVHVAKDIRERDNHICQICFKREDELIGYHKKLAIHHIDYNKNNNESKNLISLCISCHSKTCYNRDMWQQFFGGELQSY